jgi:two-component system sensor histidine kinase BarA
MKIHRKIAFSNTLIFILGTISTSIILKHNTEFSIFKDYFFFKIFLIITAFFIMSNFISKFMLINVYGTLEKVDKIMTFINNKFIYDLRKELSNMEGCFHQIFSSIKIDILDILVKEGEIKKEKEKAEKLSEKLTLLNKNLEEIVEKRTKQLKSAKEHAEAANRSKDELLAKISHEMRTPLTPIIGYSKLLKKSDLDSDVKDKLQTIHTSGIKLLNFTNELLDFSKIVAGTVDLNFEAFNAKEFFQDIYNEHAEQAKEKNLRLEIELPQNHIEIYSDKMKIYEIIKNLVHNAIKYTEKGSILCEVEIKNSFLYFNIYDSGIGISERNINYIFKSFGQINKESSGAGLGLSITKKLVEILKGDIKVKSKLNFGTTFNVTIPIEIYQRSNEDFSFNLRKLLNRSNIKIKPIILKSLLKFPIRLAKLKEAFEKRDIEEIRKLNHVLIGTYGNLNMTFIYGNAKNISLELKKDKINFENIRSYIDKLEIMIKTLSYDDIFEEYLTLENKKLKILIAEDVEENRDFLKALLKSDSIEVTCAENGLIALKKLQDNKFDIIFLDIQMPVMDGIQALHHIKSSPELKEIPTVALTAQAIIGDKEKYLPYGFDGYITKPIYEPMFFSYLEHFIK